MAKKATGNLSEAIRNCYKEKPKAKPKEIQAILQAKGFETTTAYIGTIRMNMKKGKGGGKRGRPAGSTSKRGPGRPSSISKRTAGRPKTRRTTSASGSAQVSFESLIKAKELVEAMGGVSEARAALNALEQILD